MEQQLSDDALRILMAIRERAMDGYTVMKRANVDSAKLAKELLELQSRGAVSIKGDLSEDRVGESYLSVPVSSISYVDYLLGRVRFST